MTPGLAVAVLVVALGAPAPPVENGRVETRAAAPGLDKAVARIVAAAQAPTWIGWAVALDRPRDMDSGDDRCSTANGLIHLEAPSEMHLLLRAEAGSVTGLRTLSPYCRIDAGGAAVHWMEGASAAESVAVLAGLVSGTDVRGKRSLDDRALAAIAFHAGDSATEALIDKARRAESPDVRGKALTWLAQRAAQKATAAIQAALESDPEMEVKRRAVLALSRLPGGEGVPLLIQVARTSSDRRVKREAFLSLGRSHDPRALAFFETVLK